VETINVWAQLIASIGVIVSLFYVAAQVRQNTRSSRAIVVDSLARSMHDLAIQMLLCSAGTDRRVAICRSFGGAT
jgi:hypothetical protein